MCVWVIVCVGVCGGVIVCDSFRPPHSTCTDMRELNHCSETEQINSITHNPPCSSQTDSWVHCNIRFLPSLMRCRQNSPGEEAKYKIKI